MKGIVTKSTGSNYLVKYANGLIDCKIKGKFRIKEIKTTNPIAVGDVVEFELNEDSEFGMIFGIDERKNYIIRKSTNLSREAQILAANIDHAYLVVTLAMPSTSPVFIDRCLISSEAYHIPTSLIFNKIDLYDENLLSYMRELIAIYEKAGYRCYETSATKQINIETIRNLLKGKTSVITGNSGVGKSSLMNVLDPEIAQKTAAISDYHLKGKHTTTFAEMFELQSGGWLIDTPGIKGFGMIDLEHENIANYFPEMIKLLNQCQFYNCTHTHEPKCAVKAAVESGEVSATRYNSYLSILEDDKSKYRN